MHREPATTPSRREALLVGASGGAAAVVAVLPILAMQIAVVMGAAAVTASMIMARAGRALNPAWIIVAWVYLLGPVGSLLGSAGIGLSTAALMLMASSPFVLAAVLMRPQALVRLRRLVPLLLLLLLAGLSVGWSADPAYGVEKLTLWMLTGLLPAAFILALTHGSSGVSWKLIGGVAFVYGLSLLIFGASWTGNPGRATLFDANPIWAARAAFVGVLVILFGAFPSVAKLGMVPVMVLAGLTTVSLGPAIGLAVGAWAGVAEALRCAGRADRRVALAWVAMALLAGLAVVVLLSGALDTILSSVANDPNTSSRATYLAVAGRLIGEAPVLGIGIGGFASTGLDLYPHNLVAEVASELGVVGVLILLSWFGLALRGAARSPVVVGLVVATGTFTLFSGSLAGNGDFWMFTTLAVARLPIGGRGGRPGANRVGGG